MEGKGRGGWRGGEGGVQDEGRVEGRRGEGGGWSAR